MKESRKENDFFVKIYFFIGELVAGELVIDKLGNWFVRLITCNEFPNH